LAVYRIGVYRIGVYRIGVLVIPGSERNEEAPNP